MDSKIKDKIMEAFTYKNTEYSDRTRDGDLVVFKAITFGDIHRYLKEIYSSANEQCMRPRELKKMLIELVDEEIIVEVKGEPPVYMLLSEFNKFKKLIDE